MEQTILIPPKTSGIHQDTTRSLTLKDIAAAKDLYLKTRGRLLDVNCWNELNGIKKRQYQLFNSAGEAKTGKAEEGDYIRFNLPVPKADVGHGYDWVQIEK